MVERSESEPESEPTRRVCLLVNPCAGGGRALRAAPVVERRLNELGVAVRRRDTRDLDDARRLAREAAASGETVAVLSGDGMIGAVADALREQPGAVLGVLPGGRGNDLARVLEISLDPIGACETIARGVAIALDLGEARSAEMVGKPAGERDVTQNGYERAGGGEARGEESQDCREQGRAFVGIASVGFDSQANRIANEAPAWLGQLVYAYGALRALASWRPVTFELELQPSGERLSVTGYTVGAANSRAYGGGMYAAPDALLDDGLLDVVVLERVGKLRFLTRLLPKVFSGAHVHEPCVRTMRAREVRVAADRPLMMYADGDPIAPLPARVRALPAAVRVLVPEQTAHTAFGSWPPASALAQASREG